MSTCTQTASLQILRHQRDKHRMPLVASLVNLVPQRPYNVELISRRHFGNLSEIPFGGHVSEGALMVMSQSHTAYHLMLPTASVIGH